MALVACSGSHGDLLRTRSDAGVGTTPRPRPSRLSSWQIQLSGPLDTTFDVQMYIADADTPPAVIRALHEADRIMICYFSAGTTEAFRSDAARFPAASVGNVLADYPDERWLDVRAPAVRGIMSERLSQAAAAGCDGIHPSALAAFSSATGFDFTRADQIAYDRWLAQAAHELGLSIAWVENEPSLAEEMLADFDWTVVWTCASTGCAAAGPFLAANKAAFLVEYGDATAAPEICAKAKELGLSAILKRSAELDAARVGCL